ncbi:MAG: MFS domain-containing histidine kinase [Anaerolineae bacterium]|jgi:signal transduction histidine kinase
MLEQLLQVRAEDPDDARRRKLLNILLVGVTGLTLVTLTALVVAGLAHSVSPYQMALLSQAILAILVGIAGIYMVNRRWSGALASSLFLVLLTLTFAFIDEPPEVVDGRSVFLFTIPILMASVLLRPWASFAAAGLSSAVVSAIALSLPGYIPPVPTMLGFFAFAFVSWISARNLENALRNVRALNRELDQRVEDRTRELRQANEELANANERLMELDRLKSRFVSMVSHELRTPLGAIQGFAEMLRAGIYGSLAEKQDDALRRVENNTDKLLNIVNDLLDQARIEAGEISLHPTPFSPETLVEDLQSTVGVLADQQGLDLTVEVDENVPRPVYGDKERLHQVLVNLTTNAIKFTDEGSIHVRIGGADGDDPSQWIMEVSDTGPGIAEEDKDLVFTPFRRVDDSVTREHTGVGLGLSIVRQLVELMGGNISLESEVGRGSTFTVTLPLHQEQRRRP